MSATLRVCVVELNHFHTEVFPVYAQYLPDLMHAPVEIDYFVIPRKLDELRPVHGSRVHPVYRAGLYRIASKTGLRTFYFKRCVDAIVAEHRPDVLVFNSAEPKRVYAAFKHAKVAVKVGVVHVYGQVDLVKSPGEHYFVLGPNVYEHHRPQGVLDGYFLPFFRPYPLSPPERPRGVLIGIQGNIDYRRRDYPGLLELAQTLLRQGGAGIRFNIIGGARHRDAVRLRQAIRVRGLESMFVLHDELNDADFFQQVVACDFLMPLLGPEHSRYYRFMITATLSHASAYGIPLVLARDNALAWGLDDAQAIAYESYDELARMMLRGEITQRRGEVLAAFVQGVNGRVQENRRVLRELRPAAS